MRRVEGLVEISRRDFCAFAAGCIGLAAAGCTDGSLGTVQTGPLGGDDGTTPDAGHGQMPPDAHMPPPDAPSGVTCSPNALDVGPATMFTANNPVYFSNGRFFVVRDAGGLYALTANCTHEGAATVVRSGQFYCPRHGARFTFNGAVVSGPVFQPLVHYAMCNLSNGHIGVMTGQTVSASTRLNA